MRSCGKRFHTEETARHSKRGLQPDAVVKGCRYGCGGWHVEFPAAPRVAIKPRSEKTARIYVTRRALVAEMFLYPEVCEVPWCPELATDPHEALTRARGGDILDRSIIRKVCHPHNVMFSADEQPWMYELGFLIHSWERVS
jgi:hypothetical protein